MSPELRMIRISLLERLADGEEIDAGYGQTPGRYPLHITQSVGPMVRLLRLDGLIRCCVVARLLLAHSPFPFALARLTSRRSLVGVRHMVSMILLNEIRHAIACCISVQYNAGSGVHNV